MAHHRYPTTVTVAVLLTVVHVVVVSAYVVPEVVLMRVKRNPEPMRSFSFSGFNPNGQMAAFTGLAEYPQAFPNYGPPSDQVGPYRYDSMHGAQDLSYGPPSQATAPESSYGPPPSGAEQPYSGNGANAGNQSPKVEYGTKPTSGAPYDSNEQNNNSAEQPQTDNKKKYKGRDGSSSNAEASFNAWFPIMFGVFPNGAGGGQPASNGVGSRGENNNQGNGQDQKNSYDGNNGYERSSGGTTVIANSVSNGRHGVATSHAIAYGNPRSSSQK